MGDRKDSDTESEIGPLSSDEVLAQALKHHSHGSFKRAAFFYDLYLKNEQSDPRALTNYAVICQSQGRIDEAIILYQKAINLYPHKPIPYSNLSGIYKDQGRYIEAENLLMKAIQINPQTINLISLHAGRVIS